jgi:hypothetical protein
MNKWVIHMHVNLVMDYADIAFSGDIVCIDLIILYTYHSAAYVAEISQIYL